MSNKETYYLYGTLVKSVAPEDVNLKWLKEFRRKFRKGRRVRILKENANKYLIEPAGSVDISPAIEDIRMYGSPLGLWVWIEKDSVIKVCRQIRAPKIISHKANCNIYNKFNSVCYCGANEKNE